MESSIVISIDVEWANPRVLQAIVAPLDERNIAATFFCTHKGVSVPGHERALHPNFRKDGDISSSFKNFPDVERYQKVLTETVGFCAEAVGVRPHCLFHDFALLNIYHNAGILYDSSYFMPLVRGIIPFQKEFGIWEFPIYYMDHADLVDNRTEFEIANLKLESPGLKVFDFHPNIIFANCPSLSFYEETKAHYHDYERLLEMRYQGRGAGDLFLELLDYIADRQTRTYTLSNLLKKISLGECLSM